ncbi:unnamed protein product [Parnassius apollo]|uniref:(apollo) hypothetical protein n=1 Tax=Parnassius apollo TaxID=110799 RepID=A0A8S3X6K1_PARAO|nr:unnamed protein product [Parnassius apollo]
MYQKQIAIQEICWNLQTLLVWKTIWPWTWLTVTTPNSMNLSTTDINTRQAPLPSHSLPAITRQTRKRKDNDLEAFLDIEREKMKILRQDQEDTTNDDLLWFKSILPDIKQLPSMNKLHFRTQMQELLLMELSKLNPPQPGSRHGYYTSL